VYFKRGQYELQLQSSVLVGYCMGGQVRCGATAAIGAKVGGGGPARTGTGKANALYYKIFGEGIKTILITNNPGARFCYLITILKMVGLA
jgi:hypothetical protein